MEPTYKNSDQVLGALIALTEVWLEGNERPHVDREFKWSCELDYDFLDFDNKFYTVSIDFNSHEYQDDGPDFAWYYKRHQPLQFPPLPLSCTQSDIRNLVDEAMKLIPEGEPQRVFKRQSA